MNRKDDFVDAAVRKYLLPNLRSVAKEFELEMSNEEVMAAMCFGSTESHRINIRAKLSVQPIEVQQ